MESALAPLLQDVDPSLTREHLSRLDDRYFLRFSAEQVAEHIRALAALSTERQAAVLTRRLPASRVSAPPDNPEAAGAAVECTVLAFDHPGAFSLIAGILSSMGLDIHSGEIFTYAAPPPLASARQGRGGARAAEESAALRRRRIIDQFTGFVSAADLGEEWERMLDARLREAFTLLARGGNDASRARRLVNEMAARRLETNPQLLGSVLYPVGISVDSSPAACTRITVVSQDTPFFLYTFSTALSLQGVSIEHVSIRTAGGRIEDEFEFVDASGAKIQDAERIDRIKLSVLLTKEFTSFLEKAPDALAALLRFESLLAEILTLPEQGRWFELLSNQRVLADLAQLLGASTFLWEDFIRLQYETLLPMLRPHVGDRSICEPMESIPGRLASALSGAEDTAEFARRLNEFKDREIYLFDLDHILTPGSDFLTLSRRLTVLAEAVVEAAVGRAYTELCRRFGEPRTVAGLPVRLSVMGLGKMGGAALGYASDIELLFVYSDSGRTAGARDGAVESSEFFGTLVRDVQGLIHAKREGIFHLDLRLRPYGAAGPLACSLESFCTYYATGGPALAYERLSLVRLRSVAGDRILGGRIERLRDEMVYSARNIDMAQFRELRARQMQEKTRRGELNAKFSPGALVDLEYAVQILQVIHGASEPRLRTPRIHEALEALASLGVVGQEEARELVAAYHFFRRLINGLRMLRGSARDLFLPAPAADEYMHLARRIGYTPGERMSPAQRLNLDFETHTAQVRAFVERRLGRDTLPPTPAVNAADLVLSDGIPEHARAAFLSAKGFRDPVRAFVNLRGIGGTGGLAERRSLFARLAVLALDILAERPDPDMALNNWERLVATLPDPVEHIRGMLSQPVRLEILLSIFSASQFLADTLVRDPLLLDHFSRAEVINTQASSAAIAGELTELAGKSSTREEWRDALRALRRREILKIAARDICLGVPTRRIMEEISDLAEGIIEGALRHSRVSPAGGGFRFCVLAFGKLGGRELNYSSDIDLLGLVEESGPDAGAVVEGTRLMEELRADLSAHTAGGYAYRVDLRLRPYGTSGQLVFAMGPLLQYYEGSAALWELQALLKARPVAGDRELGASFLQNMQKRLAAPRERADVIRSIDRLRQEAVRGLSRGILSVTTDVKTGLGGLRDVEFLAQGLQLIHAHRIPAVLCGSTLEALEALCAAGVLPRQSADLLSGDYLFLRRVEHFLQIYEDRQTHSLPKDPEEMRALARRMMGSGATAGELQEELARRFQRVRSEYGRFISGDL
jgi:[glutamine synthetase] adenylyltransferase / [glutamine synthetase]-adenylyl-L-tyrosine phosphorylase